MSASAKAAPPAGLTALEARLRQDLQWLELPPKPWVAPRWHAGEPMADVVVIGGGMAGLAAATAMRWQGIVPLVLDRAPEGYEGPWATTARMETLRSPKQLTGPALGLPSLTFRAWFEAQFGLQAWEALDKIDRLQWMDYLRWYRQVLGVEVHNQHAVNRITPCADDRVVLDVNGPLGARQVHARRVVLATGRDGLGAAWVPPWANALPRAQWAHSSDEMDYARLRGLRVGVIGVGASSMDSAGCALEAGAASVDLLARRPDIPRVNKGKGAGSPGMTHGYVDLPDEWKWRIRHYVNEQQTPPPRGSTLRVSRHANARFHVGCPVLEARSRDGALHLRTPKGTFVFDFVVFATGFRIDVDARPEYAPFANHIRRWADRYQPPPGMADDELAQSPDLGPVFEFREKTPGACPGLSRIHCFCYPATMSHGTVSGDIPAISEGARRLAQGLTSLLFREGIETHYRHLVAYDEPELLGDEWTPADGPVGH